MVEVVSICLIAISFLSHVRLDTLLIEILHLTCRIPWREDAPRKTSSLVRKSSVFWINISQWWIWHSMHNSITEDSIVNAINTDSSIKKWNTSKKIKAFFEFLGTHPLWRCNGDFTWKTLWVIWLCRRWENSGDAGYCYKLFVEGSMRRHCWLRLSTGQPGLGWKDQRCLQVDHSLQTSLFHLEWVPRCSATEYSNCFVNSKHFTPLCFTELGIFQ